MWLRSRNSLAIDWPELGVPVLKKYFFWKVNLKDGERYSSLLSFSALEAVDATWQGRGRAWRSERAKSVRLLALTKESSKQKVGDNNSLEASAAGPKTLPAVEGLASSRIEA